MASVNGAAGQGSNAGGFRLQDNFEMLRRKALAKSDNESSRTKHPPRIQKAPAALRNISYFQEQLEPKVYSFGPIHHGRHDLQRGEEMKQELAGRFISHNKVDEYPVYDKILKQIQTFRECYSPDLTREYSDEQLSLILFVDGCALLFYMISCTSDDFYKRRMENFTAMLSHNDLFLLENQLPYGVLEILSQAQGRGAQPPKDLSLLMEEFVGRHSLVPGKLIIRGEIIQGEWKPNHLLDLLWMKLRFPGWNWSQLPKESKFKFNEENKKKKQNQSRKITILASSPSPSYTAKKLRQASVVLKPSESTPLTQIYFERGFSLKLRSLIVDESTEVKLSNMVAYEMCPDFENDLEVTSFVCFVNSLIGDAEDVGVLISKGLLHNSLSKHEQVFILFREMAKNLVSNPYIYNDVKWEIQQYLQEMKPWERWKNELKQVYFGSPWRTVTFVASISTILLTAIQTICSILS